MALNLSKKNIRLKIYLADYIIIFCRSILSTSDCFQIGEILYWEKNYYYSALWFQEAKRRLDNTYSKEFRIDLLRYLSDSLLEQSKVLY